MIESQSVQHFYIPEDQSFYLLSHKDAQRLKTWFVLCEQQLASLGYKGVELIGQGAYGFVFSGINHSNMTHVFKFSRIDLAKHIQDRLHEEASMLAKISHPNVPQFIEYQELKNQRILVMEHGKGVNLEEHSLTHGPLGAEELIIIASQLHDIIKALRQQPKPIVHGDIKPSNVMWHSETRKVALIDWGSSVYAQLDEHQQPLQTGVMGLMSDDLQTTNARLGDIYFIGTEQLNGALSSPRFDEQGVASTLYALASGQSSRFSRQVIRPSTLGLPKEFAKTLDAMLSDDVKIQRQGGDYFMRNMPYMSKIICRQPNLPPVSKLLFSLKPYSVIDTVVYSSRKSLLRQQAQPVPDKPINDAQFERYYKHYLQGMGENQKAFIVAVSRLGKYPVVGGLSFSWSTDKVCIDSDLSLFDPQQHSGFVSAVNSMVNLARAISPDGVFKTCLFDARRTIHVSRNTSAEPFVVDADITLPFGVEALAVDEAVGEMHSYFEDGDDPDEQLQLPESIVNVVAELNGIQHSGCIIFEVLETHLKIHNYFSLNDSSKQHVFETLLKRLLAHVPDIKGIGISGYMKLPFKETRSFDKCDYYPDQFLAPPISNSLNND